MRGHFPSAVYDINDENLCFRSNDNFLAGCDKNLAKNMLELTTLVNQLAPFIATASIMAPFRDLLKSSDLKGRKVFWDGQLQEAFAKSKVALCEVAEKGLTYFDMKKETILITDWSNVGIGFVLMQKHCKCDGEVNPLCCSSGWKLALCNSRHLHKEEAGLYPVEGEMLAVVWALKKARMFLLGCPSFTIFVDHSPLTKLLADKSLGDIENKRLLKLKEKTLSYNFKIKHIKGLKNHADAFSRYPVNSPDQEDISESRMINTITINTMSSRNQKTLSVTWDDLKEHCKSDEQYSICLLYTSPSPRDLSTSRMPSSA